MDSIVKAVERSEYLRACNEVCAPYKLTEADVGKTIHIGVDAASSDGDKTVYSFMDEDGKLLAACPDKDAASQAIHRIMRGKA